MEKRLPENENNIENKASRIAGFLKVLMPFALGILCFLMSGCSTKDALSSVLDYFHKDALEEEETAALTIEERMFSVQLQNATGEIVTKKNGESVTVLAAYETAAGGEARINEKGILETYPLGQIMTYQAGEPVTNIEGIPETYTGGEIVTGVLGNKLTDQDGNEITRAAEEIVTHGDSDIVYDESGNAVRYSGEPLTYAAGEYKYNTDGDRVYSGIVFLEDENGQQATLEDGSPRISVIEVVTDTAGDLVMEKDGEVATRVLEPLLPDRVIEQAVEEGAYYIRSPESAFVWFSAPFVSAADIPVPVGAEPDPASLQETDSVMEEELEEEEQEEEMVQNLQMELLGAELPYFELRFDAEGYGYFVMQGTEMVLGIEGSIRNGANVLLQEMEKIPYIQYAYWDDPLYTLEDHQKWIIKKTEDGYYTICSVLNEDYCLTVDDKNGIHYANVMLWKNEKEKKEQQEFMISAEVPVVPKVLEEGTYFICSGLSDWMMVSIGDFNYDDSRNIYLYHSDGMDGQMFTISYDEYGLATIAHSNSSKVLSVKNSNPVNEQEIFQFESDGDPWQKWILEPVPEDGSFIIRSALNVSEVMNLIGGAVIETQPIRLYWNDNTKAQRWFITAGAPEGYATYEGMEKYAQKFSSSTSYLILVNTITNCMGVYTGSKGNWSCEHYWGCVTGKPSTPTPQGTYYIMDRIPSFDGDTDSPEWYTCYYATMFYPGYYFHSIVYYKGTMDIMDASIGVSISHGCVRLYIENAEWIYNNVPDGTTVVIF